MVGNVFGCIFYYVSTIFAKSHEKSHRLWTKNQSLARGLLALQIKIPLPLHFPGPLEGGIWSRFIFYHFDFTPWPAYCLSVLTVARIRVLAWRQVPPAHKLREVIFAPFSTRKKSIMEKLRSDLESLNTRVFKLQGAFFNFSPLNLAKSQSLYKIPYFNFFSPILLQGGFFDWSPLKCLSMELVLAP